MILQRAKLAKHCPAQIWWNNEDIWGLSGINAVVCFVTTRIHVSGRWIWRWSDWDTALTRGKKTFLLSRIKFRLFFSQNVPMCPLTTTLTNKYNFSKTNHPLMLRLLTWQATELTSQCRHQGGLGVSDQGQRQARRKISNHSFSVWVKRI